MTGDGLKNITIPNYDRRNLPLQMTLANFYYNYDDGGNRINKKAGTTNEYYLRDHTGRELLVYDNNTGRLKMANVYGNGLIGRIDVTWDSSWVQDEEGSWFWSFTRSDERFYYIPVPPGVLRMRAGKDHLGSIRMTLDENADVVGAQDFYPFGEVLRGLPPAGTNDKYMFTEKERDTETNYDYFGARFYDSELGRWLSVDPLADKYFGWSPYNYTLNNPLRFIDPDGMDVYKDDALNTELVDEDGNPIPIGSMTNEQKQIYYFQQWWAENGEQVMQLFGEGGKYESTDIYFKLGVQPAPSGLSGLFINRGTYFGYDALTTWGNKSMEDNELFRGEEEVKMTDGFSIDNTQFKLWFNPDRLKVAQSPAEHEWQHVALIFNKIQKSETVPTGMVQHEMMKKEKFNIE